MYVMRRFTLSFILIVFISSCTSHKANLTNNESVREQLVAVHGLCDEGLVSPEVCKDKERAILGLLPKGMEPTMQATSDPVTTPVTTAKPRVTEYYHPLGFHVKLPIGWQVLDPTKASEALENLRGRIKDRIPDDANADNVLRLLENRIKSGTTRLLQNGEDSINIQKNYVALPANAIASQKYCERLSLRMSASANGPLSMYDCGLRKLGEFPAFYMDHDARQAGMRTIQVWLEKTTGETIVFMMNCKNINLETRRKEFKTIITSMRWD